MGERMLLSGITVYPVKGCRGIALTHADVVATGLRYDRRWMLVDRHGNFCSQWTMPVLARIATAFVGDELVLRAPDGAMLGLPLIGCEGPTRPVSVHGKPYSGVDQGTDAAAWASRAVGADVRLVRMADAFVRGVRGSAVPNAQVAYADAFPFLVTSEASLEDLNGRIIERNGRNPHAAVRMDRFRPNLIVEGCGSYAEDRWKWIRMGNVILRNDGSCTRCAVIAVDQETGERGAEPTATLATYRTTTAEEGGDRKRKVIFGSHYTHANTGELVVGMTVDVLECR